MKNWNEYSHEVQKCGWKTEKNNKKYGPSRYEYEHEYEYSTEEEFDEIKEQENTDAYYHDTCEYER